MPMGGNVPIGWRVNLLIIQVINFLFSYSVHGHTCTLFPLFFGFGLDDFRSCRYVFRHPDVTAYCRIFTNSDTS